jgi:heme/copper-type cytochrome/quinol oxidase subunit 1
MPRRVYTYSEGSGWGALNLLETVGAYVIGLAIVVVLANVARSLRSGAPAGADPWGAETLEWATSSPPPPYNFGYLPVVASRSPLWHGAADAPVVTGLRTDRRELLLTTLMDAEPSSRHEQPENSIWPFVAALCVGVLFISLIFTEWGLVIGSVLLFPALVLWGWPKHRSGPQRVDPEAVA